MLLAIDTSAGTSVAVVDADARILAELSSDNPRGHAEAIGSLILGALDASGVRVSDLAAVAAGMGPGPFTGLRVGIAAARAFAFGARIPVLPVLSHDAIARGVTEPSVVATDARRRELFVSIYDGLDDVGLPIRVSGPAIQPAAEVTAPEGRVLVQATTVSAAALGVVAAIRRIVDRPFDADAAVYLRSPDVTPSEGPKRVTA